MEAVVTVVALSGYYNGNCLKGLRKTTKTVVMIAYVPDYISVDRSSAR
jgi:hypothetical protein